MKRASILIALILAIAMITPSTSPAQFTDNAKIKKADVNGEVFLFSVGVDSVDDYTSNAFNLSAYDGESFSTYPIAYGLKMSSTLGVASVNIFIQGTYGDGNWFVVDTLLVTDSLETYRTGSINLNNVKCLAYRVVFDGQAGNRSDTWVIVSLYAYRRDY